MVLLLGIRALALTSILSLVVAQGSIGGGCDATKPCPPGFTCTTIAPGASVCLPKGLGTTSINLPTEGTIVTITRSTTGPTPTSDGPAFTVTRSSVPREAEAHERRQGSIITVIRPSTVTVTLPGVTRTIVIGGRMAERAE